MAVTISNVSETSVYGGQPVSFQVTFLNDSGSTATINDVLLQGPRGSVCQFNRNADLPETLANGATLIVPFTGTFYASKNLDPSTRVYQSFSVKAIVKGSSAGSYQEAESAAVVVNAINPSYPGAAQIQGPNLSYLAANFTDKRRAIFIAMGQ